MKLGVISLGCDKATVDSERLVAELVGHGAVVTPDLPRADVILVNTCGFIDAAKRESIDAMLAAAKLKADGAVKAVVAVGCLVQRYEKELKEEIPEVDLFLGFSDLLETLLGETSVPWYRLLYIYSAGLSQRLVDLIAREPRIVPYIDMPIQHASDRMLERMRRPERRRTIGEKLAWLRGAIPDLAIRTTCLVGFPGETEHDFRDLIAFLDEAQFDRLGGFAYSPQEGTRAVQYPDDVPDAVKRERLEELLEVQRAISAERLARFVGREVDVLIDRVADPLDGAAEGGGDGAGATDVGA